MIETGWIFPDGTNCPCGDFIIHDLVVIQFINRLKLQDPETFAIVEKELDDLWKKQGSRNLYSTYAIRRLGWIKVGTSIWHNITYAGYDWQTDLIQPYLENNYHPQNLGLSSTSYLPLKCKVRFPFK